VEEEVEEVEVVEEGLLVVALVSEVVGSYYLLLNNIP